MITNTTGAGRAYHHNGDFSGEVVINVTEDELSSVPGGLHQVGLPMADLIDIVAAYIYRQRLEALEKATVRELLGLEAEEE